MGLTDALAEPMAEVFDTGQADWTFDAIVPAVLRSTTLPLPPATSGRGAVLPRPARSPPIGPRPWPARTSRVEDQLDTAAFNLALWRGLKGEAPYPAGRDGRDLRDHRENLLAAGRQRLRLGRPRRGSRHHRADLVVQHEVGVAVLVGGLAVDDGQARAVALGEQRESRPPDRPPATSPAPGRGRRRGSRPRPGPSAPRASAGRRRWSRS